MKHFQCTCAGKPTLFFESSSCTACGRVVGLTDQFTQVQPFDLDEATGQFISETDNQKRYVKCKNFELYQVCNSMVEVNPTDPNRDLEGLCFCCRHNETIPNLNIDLHLPLWKKMETAKRRALYTLNALRLPLNTKKQNPELGLSFDFTVDSDVQDHFSTPLKDQDRVFTGHDCGNVTINLAEADEVARAKTKSDLGERYRTLLGHFRHELGHYFFEVLVAGDDAKHALCKTYFGDDELDYQESLDQHYKNGAPADWASNYISQYATMHPYEDWAETWSHYMHIIDTLETVQSFGLSLDNMPKKAAEDIADIELPQDTNYFEAQTPMDNIINTWMEFSVVLNALNRSMGLEDAYPFVITQPVRDKLKFIHHAIHNRLENL